MRNTIRNLQDGKYKNVSRFVLTGLVSGGRKDVSILLWNYYLCMPLLQLFHTMPGENVLCLGSPIMINIG